jgi:diaminopropionate ammonia-lyase
MTSAELLNNPRRDRRTLVGSPPPQGPYEFHRRLPAYRPTRLLALDAITEELGLERLWVKDESSRLGLPAFKILGVSWAAYRALATRLGTEPSWRTPTDLREAFSSLQPLTLVTATTGNHGRAVARVASAFGLEARIFVPANSPADRVAAIADEGAVAIDCGGSYDEAVEQAAVWARRRGTRRALLLSDTAPSEGDPVATWISEGYSTLFREVEEQLAAAAEPLPDLIVVQIGAGSLALTAATHWRRNRDLSKIALLGVEAASAACFQASARAGGFRTLPGPHRSRMFCLNAGVPSRSGLARVLAGFDAFVSVGDGALGECVRMLASAGVVAGPTGAAGLVGLRAALPVLARSYRRVLLINTEGAADPTGYAQTLLS